MSLHELYEKTGLPLNRKERFYTGTVLPALLCAEGLTTLSLLPDLINETAREQNLMDRCPPLDTSTSPGESVDSSIQIFTEYNLKESRLNREFPEPALSGDTPDLILFWLQPRRSLLAIEAKVFMRTSPGRLAAQMDRQTPVLEGIREVLEVAAADVVHVALVPEALKMGARYLEENALHRPVLTWEQILRTFPSTSSSKHWAVVLEYALANWHDLASDADRYRTGAHIIAQHPSPKHRTMGCRGGIKGKRLRKDIETGSFVHVWYEVSEEAEPRNGNWFPVAQFIQQVQAAGEA